MNTPFIGFRHIAFRHSLGRFGIRSATAALFPVSRRRCAVVPSQRMWRRQLLILSPKMQSLLLVILWPSTAGS